MLNLNIKYYGHLLQKCNFQINVVLKYALNSILKSKQHLMVNIFQIYSSFYYFTQKYAIIPMGKYNSYVEFYYN